MLNNLNQTQVLTQIVLRSKLYNGAQTPLSKGISCGPNMEKEIKEFVSACQVYAQVKNDPISMTDVTDRTNVSAHLKPANPLFCFFYFSDRSLVFEAFLFHYPVLHPIM